MLLIKNNFFINKVNSNLCVKKKHYTIYVESIVNVSDNSGIQTGKCIKIKPYSKKKGTSPAGIIKMSVKKLKIQKKISKEDFCTGVFIRAKKMIQRDTGLSFKCQDNAVILIDNKNVPIASRIKGLIFRELKYRDLYPKIILMTKIKL